ncbi:MAG TPA: flagellar type III secretion system protein FliQ [Actinobacteria bacterium]|nr:flagellar type III secretion system protein FliQ [Actinomycetota bacterium]
MTDVEVLRIAQEAFAIGAELAGPMLMAALVVGVVVSVVQTITQIQEMTLTFVPKLVATGLVVLLGGNWMIRELTTWVRELWGMIAGIG